MRDDVARALAAVADAQGMARRYPAGSLLFAEGDRGTDALLIRTGTVRIVAGDQRIDEIGPGAVLGEFAAVDGLPRSASAYASTDVELVAIDAVTALRALDAAPGVDLEAVRSGVRTHRRRTQERAANAGGLPLGAVAAHLAARTEGGPGAVIALEPGTIAADLGVSLELTARALDHLHHAGVLSLERGRVVVHDPGALAHVATD